MTADDSVRQHLGRGAAALSPARPYAVDRLEVEPSRASAPLVLHVVEAWGGGVTSAVYDYVRSAPQYRHALLVGSRDAHLTQDTSAPVVESYLPLPPTRRLPQAIAAIQRAYRELRPAVVHAHSSVAGALVRMAPAVPTDAIVYTPHCFSFERRDLNRAVRGSYLAIERLLFRRAAVIAACSPREAELARELGPRARTEVRYVPNVFRSARRDGSPGPARAGLRVVGQGRLNRQKDPAFFREVAASVHAVDPTVEFTWIGGDPESEVEAMRAVGVETTGWVPRHVVLEQLARAQVYLHTASWEGAPVALLEAAACGLAVVARDIPAMSSLDVPLRRSTAAELAELVLALRDPTRLGQARRQSVRWLDANDPQEQVAALGGIYLDVTRQTLPPLLPRAPGRGAQPVGRR